MTKRITLGNLTLDRESYDVWIEGQRIDLTYVEFELLLNLAASADKVVSHERLLEALWGKNLEGGQRRLAVHISRLRKKIAGSGPYGIKTVAKRGYCFSSSGAEISSPGLTSGAEQERQATARGHPQGAGGG